MRKEEYRELLKLSLDLHFLRTQLIPGLDLCSTDSWYKSRKDLKELSALHGASLRVCKKSSDDTVVGTFDDVSLRIDIISSAPGEKGLPPEDILYNYTHELAHAIQYQIISGIPYHLQTQFFGRFRNAVKQEQVAESLAYYISLNYFPTLSSNLLIKRDQFKTYHSVEDILYIANRYDFDPSSAEVKEAIKALEDL